MKRGIFLILLIPFTITVLLTILLSFYSSYVYPEMFPDNFTLRYWENLFSKGSMTRLALLQGIHTGILTAVFATITGFFTARGVVKYLDKYKNLTRIFYTLPLFIPATALFIGVHQVMIRLALNNTLAGVVLAHCIISIPFSVNIAISFFQGISPDLENVAKTLGSNRFFLIYKILVPLLLPGIFLSFAICFLLSFSDYFAVLLIGGGNIITFPVLYYPFINNADYGNSAVMSIVFLAVNMMFFVIAEIFTKKYAKVQNYLFE